MSETTWEFTLRQGVRFHDGAPLTAEDVKATLERNMVPGKTVVQPGFATFEAVQVVSPTTIRIVTKKPDPLLLVRVAQMGSQIVPARLTTDDGVKELARRPVGTGAYRFVEWVKDERLVMEANRDWWGWEGKAPAIERIVWKPIPDDFPRIVALEKGEADVITNVPPDRLKALAEGRTTKVVSTPATRTVTFWINTTQPPLADKRVRQALHYGLDVGALVKNLYAGMGKPFSGGLADTDFGYNPALKPYPFDPAKAKRLLAEAGRAGGIDLTLYGGSGTMVNDKFLLEAMADMWAKVGIRAKVEMMEMGARQRMNNERTLPVNSLMLINPQSTLLDADGSMWRSLPPERLRRQVLGGEPAGPALPRADGAGALHARREEAPRALRRGDRDHPRGEAVARAVPGGRCLRRVQACAVQAARGLPADRGGNDARPVAPLRSPAAA